MTSGGSPEWLKIGAKVAAVSNNRHGQSVALSTVEKIGKRDVVLADGQRFNVRYLHRREGGTYGWTVVLLDADDPFVAKTRAEIRRANELNRARSACDQFLRDKATAFDVILALAPLTGVAAEIAALDSEGSR